MASVVAAAVVAAKMNLQHQIKRRLSGHRFFESDAPIVVAVSGGVDSMVLMDVMQHLTDPSRLIIAHVNHELRAQSREEEAFLTNYCQKHGLKLVISHWPINRHPQTGIEAAARTMRYRFFAQTIHRFKAEFLLTAHHANDQAETMLMKMVRGGQLTALSGIDDARPFAGATLLRPLLAIPKADLYKYARTYQLTWFEDVTNQDLTLTRNRFRNLIVPAMIRENPRFLEHMTSWHEQLSDLLVFSQDSLNRLLDQITKGEQLKLSKYCTYPKTWRHLIMQQWLENQAVFDLTRSQIMQIDQVLNDTKKPQQVIALPKGHCLIKEYNVCWLKNAAKKVDNSQKKIVAVVELGQWHEISDELTFGIFDENQLPKDALVLAAFNLPVSSLPLKLRGWQKDDCLRLKNGGHQKVRRVLINAKVPMSKRMDQLVLTTAKGTVLWVVGYKFAWLDGSDSAYQDQKHQVIAVAQRKC
ncbi:tRNA lysidine(34) synthetase TilS [Limosilactobacillus mucosae]